MSGTLQARHIAWLLGMTTSGIHIWRHAGKIPQPVNADAKRARPLLWDADEFIAWYEENYETETDD